jgi:tetratricopeptide (TPR) repeat protein
MRFGQIIFFVFVLRGWEIFAQTLPQDPLQAQLQRTRELIDTKKYSDAQMHISKILLTAYSQGNGWCIGEAQYQLGQINQFIGQTDSAIILYDQSATSFELYNFPERQARTLSTQARLIQGKRQYVEATERHFKVLKIYNEKLTPAQAEKNLDIKASTLERMAVLMTNQKQYDQAEAYALEAYQLFEKFGDKGLLEICCTAVGNVYFWKNEYDKAGLYYQKAVDICAEIGRKSGRPLNNLAIVQSKAKHYDEAIATYNKAIEEYQATPFDREKYSTNPLITERVLIAQTYSNIGSTYHYKGDLDNAKKYIMRGLDSLKVLNSTAGLSEMYDELVTVLSKKGDFALALDYQKRIKVLQDSAFYNRRQTELLELQTRFDSEKKNKEILLLNQDKKVRDLQLERQTLDLINQRLLTEKNMKNIEILKQAKALQEAQLARTEAAFDIEKQEKLAQKALLDVATRDRLLQKNAVDEARTKLWILGGILTIIMAFGAALWQIFRQRQKAEIARAEVEKMQIEQKNKEAFQEMEMKLLRSQMNPHFMFNVLNSINRYVLENDSVQASTYLTKFSRLMRLVLENSRSEKVTLENELAALSLYIELETLRFKDKISYSLTVDPSVDKRFTRLPPLMIQPYVENAIWHGLMHREDGGRIDIHLSHPTENQLEVEIVDNGIGRKAAIALKSKSATDKKSFGMQITSERLALVNTLYNTDTSIQISDLEDKNGNSLGTKVTLRIPC